jgi:hypothetical protein
VEGESEGEEEDAENAEGKGWDVAGEVGVSDWQEPGRGDVPEDDDAGRVVGVWTGPVRIDVALHTVGTWVCHGEAVRGKKESWAGCRCIAFRAGKRKMGEQRRPFTQWTGSILSR